MKSDILQPIAEVAKSRVKTPKSKNRILVIDDESDITLTFEQILEGEGFEVDSFNDPNTALSNFSPGIYDIALIDVKMSKMNGFDLYRKLKDIDDNVKYCFITASGTYRDTLRKDHPELDVDWFITKPIDAGQLVNEIKSKLHS